MNFSELENCCEGKLLQLKKVRKIEGIITDSRTISIQTGMVFFAIEGDNHDGHLFIEDAYDKGIRMFVIEKTMEMPQDSDVFVVDNAIRAMQSLVAHHRRQFDLPVIGITGSNGKTIIKEWLGQMLDLKFKTIKSPKSYNSQIGVPLSVWSIADHHNLGIFEAGISQGGEMEYLERVIQPTIGVFSNIGSAHDAGFDSLEEKIKEKAILFQNVKKVIFCQDHHIILKVLSEKMSSEKLIGWKLVNQSNGVHEIDVRGNCFKLKLKFTDTASVENSIHCAVVLFVLGFDEVLIQQRINALSGVKMRLEMKQAMGRSYVIDDTYNNDLKGLEVALDFLQGQQQKSKKTVILSDLFQTGLANYDLYSRVNELLQKHAVSRFVGIGEGIGHEKNKFLMPSEFYKDTQDFMESEFPLNDEIVLVKGSRNFKFERIVDRLDHKTAETSLEINMERLVHNLNFYRSKLETKTKMMVMVKAFAYGGGNFEIANLLQFHKVDYLGVAYVDEAIALRKNGIHIPIMIMNPSPATFRHLKHFNLEPEIYSLEQLIDYIDYFENEETLPSIHLKLETGMNRLGFKSNEISRLADILKTHKNIRIRSVFSHLVGSDDPRHEEFTRKQAQLFEEMCQPITNGLWYTPMKHLVNSAGISRFKDYHYDMVRLGIGLHGFDPSGIDQQHIRSVSTLKSHISQIKHIAAGESIGYNRMGIATKDMKIAVIPIGYADGYLRAFGNGVGKMNVKGHLVPTVGNVCMDMTIVDVSDFKVTTGEEVIVFGEQPSIKNLADWIGTIPYEIQTNISQRVKRVFVTE